MNKIVAIGFDKKEQALLEEILYEVVRAGAELFFVATWEHGVEVAEREQPQLIFVEGALQGEVGKSYEGRVVFVGEGAVLTKPLRKERVLEICNQRLDLGITVPETMSM